MSAQVALPNRAWKGRGRLQMVGLSDSTRAAQGLPAVQQFRFDLSLLGQSLRSYRGLKLPFVRC
jgi:hypothetical protein